MKFSIFKKPTTYAFTQNKVLYCYTVLLLWIFVLIIGLYKYLGMGNQYDNIRYVRSNNNFEWQPEVNIWNIAKFRSKIYKPCAPVQSLVQGAESYEDDLLSLEGVLLIFRHGDRGPVNHVRNLESMSCDYNDNNGTAAYNDYVSFVTSQWSGQISNNLYQYFGQPNSHNPFSSTKQCEIGQLTINGFIQHLKLGSLLRIAYFDKLFRNNSLSGNIYAYTTKYRRTFQSLSAFLFGFLKQQFRKIPLRTASSIYFCFDDCACPAAEVLNKAVVAESNERLKSHPAIIKLVEEMSSLIYTMSDGSFIKDPHYIKDALLAYICHNKRLPCSTSKCVSPEYISRIFSYIEWDLRQLSKSIERHKLCILSTYGLLKNMMFHLLKIVSNERPKLVLYSAHDKTITYLLTTLGITSLDAVSPVYASRVIFEVYAKKSAANSPDKKFFRLIYNGRDVTRKIKFCAKKKRTVPSNNNLNVTMCSFESFIRFLHDDYFLIFNSVNFKDACTVTRN